MNTTSLIEGPIPVLPTVFQSDNSILADAVSDMIGFARGAGITAVCLPAFGSEFYKLSGPERTKLLAVAAGCAGEDLCVIAQCNHPHGPVASQAAREAEDMGCGAVSTALPRAFPVAESALVDYATSVMQGTSLPCILQDWNPSGASISVAAIAEIKKRCPNFACVKLEEPGAASKIKAITEATGGTVKVLGGWGGYYLMEQLPAGVHGLMPGLPLIDVFKAIWDLGKAGDHAAALARFLPLMPFIEFSLRSFEQFHHAEKTLAHKRGLIPNRNVRQPTLTLDPNELAYLDFITDALMESFDAP